ncbi:MAG: hypothetical protein A3J24_01745 [Deltaproteobacteria bacterium RIFCSPLOWO2_02_FULL_53_8]|nr:MAG: hypothetical protein A3J24_01745 [Deltaproteobacteria bacterium RIFCSPLOWO2_02_FULL_53_8]
MITGCSTWNIREIQLMFCDILFVILEALIPDLDIRGRIQSYGYFISSSSGVMQSFHCHGGLRSVALMRMFHVEHQRKKTLEIRLRCDLISKGMS